MSRRRKKAEERRGSVLDSLTTKPSGSVTTHGAKLMATPLGGTATVCTVTHYCRTSVFEFPDCHLISQEPILHQVICESESFKAAVVSDLNDYFKQGHSAFSHFAIDVSLRDGVDRVYSREVRQNKAPKVPMFLVIEQHEKVPSTTFEDGECYLIDECRDGKAMIEGGREGERALLAFRTGNGAWPNFSPAKHAVNTVLVAVKVEQNLTHHIEERCSCSCFVSDDGRAVYAVHPTMSIGFGGVRVTSPVDPADLGEKVIRVRAIHDGLRRDSVSRPQVAELIDSVLLDKTKDDGHYRLWYLRLWQAAADAKRLLGEPEFEDATNIIAGKLTPKELKQYRHSIAHWWTGKVDFSFITGIQLTVLKILRRKYLRGVTP